MDIHRTAAFNRPLDLNNTGNFLILLITASVIPASVIYHYFSTESLMSAVLSGFRTGIIVFLTWAVSRELDPDNDLSAFVAVTLVLIFIPLLEQASVLPIFWILLMLRTLNRSSGVRPGVLDMLFILILGTLLTSTASWIYGLLTALGLLLDSKLPPSDRLHFWAGTLMGIITLLSVLTEGLILPDISFSTFPILIIVAILFLPVIMGSSEIKSVADRTEEKLDPTRVIMAQLMALVVVLSFSLTEVHGWLYAMYCVLAGTGLYRIFFRKLLPEEL